MDQEPQKTAQSGNNGQFKPGNTGKPPGTLNKLTRTVKETVLAVFNDLQEDPQANLTAWAKKEPTEFYKIAAKLIPTDIKATIETENVKINLTFPEGE